MPKHKGSISDTQIDRDREIYRIYRNLRSSGQFENLRKICIHIANMQADRHYISEQRAKRILLNYCLTHTIKTTSAYKRRMYESFINHCMELMQHHSNRLYDIYIRAVYMPSDGFGLSPIRIFDILRKMGAK